MEGIQYSYHFGFKNAFCNLDLQYIEYKQAEKLKSRKMKEGWMKNDEGWKVKDEGWGFQAVEGFCFKTDGQTTNEQTFAIVELLSQLKNFMVPGKKGFRVMDSNIF